MVGLRTHRTQEPTGFTEVVHPQRSKQLEHSKSGASARFIHLYNKESPLIY
jgi:hypothetical protein|uniref:Uncharacterized protein n=1 Tax=Picea glauca TaxID=3330 RepID=A0A101LZT5_PICGL|nr:hypothetical protein ABT39_MTgene5300 [Picea glauca]